MSDLDSLVNETKTVISAIIQKPKMTMTLLKRPPFRYLVDIITAITKQTGFAEGLYSSEELISYAKIGLHNIHNNAKEKKKIYLKKIIYCVEICSVSLFNIIILLQLAFYRYNCLLLLYE